MRPAPTLACWPHSALVNLALVNLVLACASNASAQALPSAASSSLELKTVTVAAAPLQAEWTSRPADAASPQSVLSASVITDIATPFADFGTLANLTPSFISTAPNGQGFDAAKNMSLRGFPDGQFNITLDGIPFADPDSLTHHSTSVFPAATLDHVLVDRSPGTASTLGYSTLGGSINLGSVEIAQQAGNLMHLSLGSFGTRLAGLRVNSAKPTASGQTGLLINLEHLDTDGAISNAPGKRDDLLIKSETLLGDGQLTLLYSLDQYHFDNPPSVSAAQVAQYGPRTGFTTVPGSLAYNGYAHTDRNSDFGYARLDQALSASWRLTETLYTYSYSSQGLGLSGDITSSAVGAGYGVAASDIAGRLSDDSYRTVGNILQLEHKDDSGLLRTGLWLDHSHQRYTRNAKDLSTGQFYNINKSAQSAELFDYSASLSVVQPFIDYEWAVSPRFTLRTGLRYLQVRRGFEAAVVPNSLPGTGGVVGRSVSRPLPSLDARYLLDADTHGYVQWSTGALVPSQSFFYTRNPALGNQAAPQTSNAYQVGITRGGPEGSLTLDAYRIDVNNYVSSVTQGGITSYINAGRVHYRGLELEGQRYLGAGISGVMNASLIRAQYESSGITSATQMAGDTIPLAPSYLGLAGLLYEHDVWRGSLLSRFVGAEYQGKNGSSDGPNFRVAPYRYTDLTLSRELGASLGLHKLRLALQIQNLMDSKAVTDTGGPSIAGPLLVNVLPPRSFVLSLSASL